MAFGIAADGIRPTLNLGGGGTTVDESMDDEKPAIISPLSRKLTRDGWTLDIRIYEDGNGKWLLEVVDERSTSTCWSEPFDTEKLALDEALRAIAQEGIAAFSESLPYRDE